jgi:molecular chaperone DnaJ
VTDDNGGGGGDPFGGQNPFAGFGGFGGFGGGGFPGGGGFHYTTGGGGRAAGGAEDIFEMFTSAMKREQSMAGRDVRAGLSLSFLEAVNGCTKDVSFEYAIPDKSQGGRTRRTKSVRVDIPAGVESGMTVKMAGQGAEAAVGKSVGDLYIELDVEGDPYFRREKYDIFTDVHVGMAQAALGCSVDVCTLDGVVEMKVKAGTQPGTNMSLRGKGVKHLNSNGRRRGNHYVKVNVEIPTKLTDRQKQLLEEFIGVEGAAAAESDGGKNKTFVKKAWERLQSFLGQSSDDAKAKSSSSG